MDSNVIDLSKGVLIRNGECAIDIYSQSLLRNTLSSGVWDANQIDELASALRFGELLLGEVQKRYPRTRFEITVDATEDRPMNVQIVLHSDPNKLFADVTRLASDMEANQRHKWVIRKGSQRQQEITSRFEKQTSGEEDVTYITQE